MTVSFDDARAIADAVLFEGYLLYPYRASAQKNQLRWQFGVLNPRLSSESGSSEPWAAQTECLVEASDSASGDGGTLRVAVRFLQVQARTVEQVIDGGFRQVPGLDVDGVSLTAWDEGVEREVGTTVPLTGHEQVVPFTVPGGKDLEILHDRSGAIAARLVRRRYPIGGVLRIAGDPFDGPYPLWKVRVRVENLTAWPGSDAREEVLRRSLVAAHTLLGIQGGAFVSLLEPPEWAKGAAAGCENLHTWPVLVGQGRRDVMLSSPIILYDYPTIAAESPGELFDGTEIDEILTLRTMTLTDEEKREARATDARAAALIDRVDDLPGDVIERLHGAVRYLRNATATGTTAGVTTHGEPAPPTFGVDPSAPWWDPGEDASVSPESDSVVVAGVPIAKGSRVRLRPNLHGADAQDMFLTGREAIVEAVFFDVDGMTHLAVTVADDPAADLQQRVGRFLYFSPDEVLPLKTPGTTQTRGTPGTPGTRP